MVPDKVFFEKQQFWKKILAFLSSAWYCSSVDRTDIISLRMVLFSSGNFHRNKLRKGEALWRTKNSYSS